MITFRSLKQQEILVSIIIYTCKQTVKYPIPYLEKDYQDKVHHEHGHNQNTFQALVTSKLDYCNSLMLGSTKYNIAKL